MHVASDVIIRLWRGIKMPNNALISQKYCQCKATFCALTCIWACRYVFFIYSFRGELLYLYALILCKYSVCNEVWNTQTLAIYK